MLRGAKVVLTEFLLTDKDAPFRWINDAETVRLNAPYRLVEWGSTAWWDSLGTAALRVMFAIRERPDSDTIGTVQLVDIHAIHRSSELVIRIGDEVNRGKGFGTEAVKLATEFAFNNLNLIRVWLRVFQTTSARSTPTEVPASLLKAQ